MGDSDNQVVPGASLTTPVAPLKRRASDSTSFSVVRRVHVFWATAVPRFNLLFVIKHAEPSEVQEAARACRIAVKLTRSRLYKRTSQKLLDTAAYIARHTKLMRPETSCGIVLLALVCTSCGTQAATVIANSQLQSCVQTSQVR